MELPDHYPREIRLIAETGFQASSGNVARIKLTSKGKSDQVACVVLWKTDPTQIDKQEFEQQLASLRVVRGPDFNNPMVASKMLDFLKR